MQGNEKRGKLKNFFKRIPYGILMGIAFIIPGFSGGSVAVIVGIYDELVGAIADFFRSFKKSVSILLPVFIGMLIGIGLLIYPLKWALNTFPIPTVSLFVGLTIGAIPSFSQKLKGKVSAFNIISIIIPLVIALSMSFIPVSPDVSLVDIHFVGYILLFFVGMLGSMALVVPGISGSMLLLILGYYNPIVRMITDNLFKGQDVGSAIAILATVALGILVGFLIISKIMKTLLAKYPRNTYFSILGFIIGSIPTVYVSTIKESGFTVSTLPTSAIYWIMSVLLLAMGIAFSLWFVWHFHKVKNKRKCQNLTDNTDNADETDQAENTDNTNNAPKQSD